MEGSMEGFEMDDIAYASAIAVVLGLGGLLFGRVLGSIRREDDGRWILPDDDARWRLLQFLLPSLHLVATYMPWITLAAGAEHGEGGSPWWQHLAYAGILVLAAPGLTALLRKGDCDEAVKNLKEALSRLTCGRRPPRGLVLVQLYVTTLLAATDQYLDMNTTVIMNALGYEHWGWALACFVVSLLMQALTMAFCLWCINQAQLWWLALVVLAGINLDAFSAIWAAGERDWHRNLEAAAAMVAAVRFVTECVPQAAFALHFAHSQELTSSGMAQVYGSVVLSTMVAGLGFRKAVRLLLWPRMDEEAECRKARMAYIAELEREASSVAAEGFDLSVAAEGFDASLPVEVYLPDPEGPEADAEPEGPSVPEVDAESDAEVEV